MLLLMPVLASAQPSKYRDWNQREEPDRFERLENQLRNIPRGDCCGAVTRLEDKVDRIGLEQSARTSRLSGNEDDIKELRRDHNSLASTVVQLRIAADSEAKIAATFEKRMDRLHSMFWFLIGGIILAVLLKSPSSGKTVRRHIENLKGGNDE